MTFSNVHELDVLKWESMTDTVRKFPSTGPQWFRNNLFTTKKALRGTDVVMWDEITKTRRRAPYATRGQPAQRMAPLTRGVRTASVADIYVSKQLDAHNIEYLRQYGTADQSGAQQIIADELADLVDIVNNTVEHACMSVAAGSLSIDQTASATNAKSRGIKFTLTFPVTTLSRLTPWNQTTTKIYTTEISAITDKAAATYGIMPTRAIHSRDVADVMLQNDEIKQFLGEQYKTQLLNSGFLTQIRGINHYLYDTGDDNSGSFAKYWTAGKILYLPPENRYFEIYEADSLIPSNDGNSLTRVTPGLYSYAVINKNPPGIELFVGYRFLPINRFPEQCIYYTT